VLITRAEIDGDAPTDLRIACGRIAEIGCPCPPRRRAGARCAGGALLPGLHDHHLHLMALAAAEGSVRCGPPQVRSAASLASALRAGAGGSGWIRGVGYHESVAGPLDRALLDTLAPDRPVRIQHRAGRCGGELPPWIDSGSTAASILRASSARRPAAPPGGSSTSTPGSGNGSRMRRRPLSPT
jgi:hypothetical protein